MKTYPSHMYRDPLEVLIRKESAIENRVRDCRGCARLSLDASGEMIIATCELKLKVGRKISKCAMYRESE